MEADRQKRWKTSRRAALAVLYVSFLLSGALAGLELGLKGAKLPSEFFVRAHLILAIPLSLASLQFCSADAKLAGKTLLEMARLGIFFCWPVGVPVYLIWSRGLRGLGVVLLHGLPLCIVWISSGAATIVLVSVE